MPTKDNIYSQPISQIADFQFDEAVVGVFSDMINRSVPGYSTIIAMSGVLAARYAQPNTSCYDLGCSLGGTTLAMREQIHTEHCNIVAVDNSAEMIARFETVLEKLADSESATATDGKDVRVKPSIEMQHADILDVEITQASVVALNFTLQFIAKEQRSILLQRIYDGLKPGGILILSEKLQFEDDHLDSLFVDMHHEFKKGNGYSDLEISQKRTALENVLLPETLTAHKARLASVGFRSTEVWFQCFNFASMVAIK